MSTSLLACRLDRGGPRNTTIAITPERSRAGLRCHGRATRSALHRGCLVALVSLHITMPARIT
eukprot:5028182-Lingulodinium_polyedra.AAC.1